MKKTDNDVISKEITETTASFVSGHIVKRVKDSHKGTYGTLVSVTGSRSMPGAAVLSGKAALRSGLGLLKQCAVPESIAPLAAAFPEPVYVPVRTDEDGFYTADNAGRLLDKRLKVWPPRTVTALHRKVFLRERQNLTADPQDRFKI